MAYKLITKIIGDPSARAVKRARGTVERINGLEPRMQERSDEQLKALTDEFRARLAKGESLDALLPEAFAAVREAAKRNIGQRHFDEQLIGGIVLHDGGVAEMRTGEGKTLVATAPVFLNALEGKGVHYVTVNDYLARLATGWMGKVYHALGLSVGVIVPDAVFGGVAAFMYDPEYTSEHEHGDDRLNHLRPVARAEAYNADITYGTNNEFGFDYLRDNMVSELGNMVQRPLHYGIVDEADSIFIDEARTPLIISAPGGEATDKYYEFAKLAGRLREGEDADYTLDEKLKAASLTDLGIRHVEEALGVDNVYEAGRIDDVHHIENALRAVSLYKRDRDYVVNGDEIIIVDEFTGRLMPGRRWSDGLHQAIEAKEGVKIQQESMTLASITFQNYFRLYKKLSGMTGTAATEAEELVKIYNLDVVVIPTHMPMVRDDMPDRIYKTEAGKFRSVAREVAERHAKGQPVLIGTVSIARNELMTGYLNELGVPHKVLNAKNNEGEAAVVAGAGQLGAVTLATNIAGRGTDIMLGEGVTDLGGLHVIGTERHESRRIDNQLRGRAGRQGDPGSSQFYVSLEDDLMRIFGSDRVAGVMNALGLDEETPIEHKMISKSLESAQKKVEGHNFDSRKQVVEYDDVMNKHRETIYTRRRRALAAENLRGEIEEMVAGQLKAMIAAHSNVASGELDVPGLTEAFSSILPMNEELAKTIARSHPSELLEIGTKWATEVYDNRAGEFGEDTMKLVERFVYVNAIDRLWMEHLEAMDSLRDGIGLRSLGQRDPLVEYKRESFKMFQQLMRLIDAEVATMIFRVALRQEAAAEGPAEGPAPVETALTRAAASAHVNTAAAGDGGGGSDAEHQARLRSRAERRAAAGQTAGHVAGTAAASAEEAAKPKPFVGHSATKQTNVKRKKKRK